MFGLGPGEIILILVVLLLVFGAKRLPEIGGALGKGIREFKSSVRDMESELSQSQRTGHQPPVQAPPSQPSVPPAQPATPPQTAGPSAQQGAASPGGAQDTQTHPDKTS
jgi:sec-independent protein translocase protein TatA